MVAGGFGRVSDAQRPPLVDAHRHFLPPAAVLRKELGWEVTLEAEALLLDQGDGIRHRFPSAVASAEPASTGSGSEVPGVLSIHPRVFGVGLGHRRHDACLALNAAMATVAGRGVSARLGVASLTSATAAEETLTQLAALGLPGCVVSTEEVASALTSPPAREALVSLLEAGIAIFAHPAGGIVPASRTPVVSKAAYPLLTALAYVAITEALREAATPSSRILLSHLPTGAAPVAHAETLDSPGVLVCVSDWSLAGAHGIGDDGARMQAVYGSDFPYRSPAFPADPDTGVVHASNNAIHAFLFGGAPQAGDEQ